MFNLHKCSLSILILGYAYSFHACSTFVCVQLSYVFTFVCVHFSYVFMQVFTIYINFRIRVLVSCILIGFNVFNTTFIRAGSLVYIIFVVIVSSSASIVGVIVFERTSTLTPPKSSLKTLGFITPFIRCCWLCSSLQNFLVFLFTLVVITPCSSSIHLEPQSSSLGGLEDYTISINDVGLWGLQFVDNQETMI